MRDAARPKDSGSRGPTPKSWPGSVNSGISHVWGQELSDRTDRAETALMTIDIRLSGASNFFGSWSDYRLGQAAGFHRAGAPSRARSFAAHTAAVAPTDPV